MRSLGTAFAAVVAAAVLAPSALPAPAKVGPPTSIASTGDSITRAFNTGPLPLLDAPANSWSTGANAGVASHYRRILAVHPAIAGRTYNDAETGARMVDLLAQVTTAGARRVEYVTVLMGANDVCRSSEAAMTSVEDFRAQFAVALARLSATLPDARIYVVSIPDVYRLWEVLRGNVAALLAWSTFDICQSMLARPLSLAAEDIERRERVRARNMAFNGELADVCARYVHCRFDGNAVFETAFAGADVSTLDYFHPSLAGQAKLAAISWAAGFDFTDTTAPTSAASSTTTSSRTVSVTLTAVDDVGVAGIEYRTRLGSYVRYLGPLNLRRGTTLTFRAVDVNGNVEATRSLRL